MPGQNIDIEVEAINRSSANVKLQKIVFHGVESDTTMNLNLPQNENQKFFANLTIPKDASYSTPYWLTTKGSLGMYHVDKRTDIGKPESKAAIQVEYQLDIDGRPISCLLYTSPSPRDATLSRMPSSA